jgi:colanic acid biosynthesis protein WcaH
MQAIRTIEAAVGGRASQGLPKEVFRLLTQLTPMLNVELFIREPSRGTLFTWRADEFDGPGWHVPGGIIRFRETAADRVCRTAQNELAAEVAFDPLPFAVREHVLPSQPVRAHFVSLLYRCTLQTPLDPAREAGDGPRTAGQWQWHATCPNDIIEVQRCYAEFV